MTVSSKDIMKYVAPKAVLDSRTLKTQDINPFRGGVSRYISPRFTVGNTRAYIDAQYTATNHFRQALIRMKTLKSSMNSEHIFLMEYNHFADHRDIQVPMDCAVRRHWPDFQHIDFLAYFIVHMEFDQPGHVDMVFAYPKDHEPYAQLILSIPDHNTPVFSPPVIKDTPSEKGFGLVPEELWASINGSYRVLESDINTWTFDPARDLYTVEYTDHVDDSRWKIIIPRGPLWIFQNCEAYHEFHQYMESQAAAEDLEDRILHPRITISKEQAEKLRITPKPRIPVGR